MGRSGAGELGNYLGEAGLSWRAGLGSSGAAGVGRGWGAWKGDLEERVGERALGAGSWESELEEGGKPTTYLGELGTELRS